jgi:dephospho-CoA kinase
VIGLIGRPGSGKDVCATRLLSLITAQNINGIRMTFSDLLGQTLDEYGVEKNRDNLQQLALFIQQRHTGGLSYRMKQHIGQSLSQIVIVDGIRWQEDMEMVRSFQNSFVIFLTAPVEMRFHRLKARGQKPGESTMSFDDFTKAESVATETEIENLGKLADIEVSNEGSIEDLNKMIGDLWEKQIAPLVDK